MKFEFEERKLPPEPLAYIDISGDLHIQAKEYEQVIVMSRTMIDLLDKYEEGNWEPFDENNQRQFFKGDSLYIEF